MMLKMEPIIRQHVQKSSESISPSEISPTPWGQKPLSRLRNYIKAIASAVHATSAQNTQQSPPPCTEMSELLAGRFFVEVSRYTPLQDAVKAKPSSHNTYEKPSVETPSPLEQRAKLFAQLGIRGEKTHASPEEIDMWIATLSHIETNKRIEAAHTISDLYEELSPEKQMHARINLILMVWRDEDAYARIAAIKTLGRTGMSDVAEALHVALRDEEQIVRAAAARALGGIPGNAAMIALIAAAMRANEHWSVRAAALRAMGTSGERSFLNTIYLSLEDEDDSVRIAAIQALAHLEGLQAAPRLALIAQRDRQPHVKHAAILAIENLATGSDERHT
jgi:hypothetical protein